jgi:hypothetical protein
VPHGSGVELNGVKIHLGDDLNNVNIYFYGVQIKFAVLTLQGKFSRDAEAQAAVEWGMGERN